MAFSVVRRFVVAILAQRVVGISLSTAPPGRVYFEKIRVFKTVNRLYIIAWNNN